MGRVIKTVFLQWVWGVPIGEPGRMILLEGGSKFTEPVWGIITGRGIIIVFVFVV